MFVSSKAWRSGLTARFLQGWHSILLRYRSAKPDPAFSILKLFSVDAIGMLSSNISLISNWLPTRICTMPSLRRVLICWFTSSLNNRLHFNQLAWPNNSFRKSRLLFGRESGKVQYAWHAQLSKGHTWLDGRHKAVRASHLWGSGSVSWCNLHDFSLRTRPNLPAQMIRFNFDPCFCRHWRRCNKVGNRCYALHPGPRTCDRQQLYKTTKCM